MANSQQNVLESKTDQQRMDLHFEAAWPKVGKRIRWQEPLDEREIVSQLGGLTIQIVLVNSQSLIFDLSVN